MSKRIPIKIAGKKYKIKPISELTTSEFCELSTIENCDAVQYIAWQTGLTFDDSFYAKTSNTIIKEIGQQPDISKLKLPLWCDYNKNIDTVGQRHQIESSKVTGLELLVFCLAVSQAQSNNIDHVNKLIEQYKTRPFADILPAGFFFFKSYKNGRKYAPVSLRVRQCLTKIARLRNRQGWRNLMHTQIT